MFLCSLIEELCTKEENDKTGCKLNFGHECIFNYLKKGEGKGRYDKLLLHFFFNIGKAFFYMYFNMLIW